MCALESDLRVQEFFVMDENFLLNKKRALQLLDLMEKHGKPWSLKVFSSIKVLQQYTMEQLVALGVVWVWLGLEGKDSRYDKLAGTDTMAMVRSLQSHGIRVLGSSIIGLEEHTRENIDEVIDYAVAHNTDLHQFMLYTPIPGTPLFAELEAKGAILGVAEMSPGDIHGQLKFNYRHPHIRDGEETEFLLRAFHRDFEINGPSIVRIIRTLLRGWKRYKNHPNPRIRARFAHEAANLPVKYAGALWAARRRYRDDPHRFQLISDILDELYAEFGWKARLAAPIVGFRLYHALRREERRLKSGWTYEPPTFFETNSADGPPGATRVVGVIASAASGRKPATVFAAEPAEIGARSLKLDRQFGREARLALSAGERSGSGTAGVAADLRGLPVHCLHGGDGLQPSRGTATDPQGEAIDEGGEFGLARHPHCRCVPRDWLARRLTGPVSQFVPAFVSGSTSSASGGALGLISLVRNSRA